MLNISHAHNAHWSQVLVYDLLTRVTPQVDETDLLTSTVIHVFSELGQHLDLGHTVVALTPEQQEILSQPHPLVYTHPKNQNYDAQSMQFKPLVICNGFAYFHRQWQQEFALAEKIRLLMGTSSQTEKVYAVPQNTDISHLPDSMNEQQRQAVITAISSDFTLITGGPGTGKTWTVAQLVLTMLRANPGLKIALCAPTGKASQRMQEALNNNLTVDKADTPEDIQLKTVAKQQLSNAQTIHRLLGLGFGGKPKFHADKPLPFDLVVVDEASMLGVELANQLIQAVGVGTKLILLGDANQLAAVDAGAVLSDLCQSSLLQNNYQELLISRRFDAKSGVGQLAKAILDAQNHTQEAAQASIAAVHKVLQEYADVSMNTPHTQEIYHKLWHDFTDYQTMVGQLLYKPKAELAQHIQKLFTVFDTYRILTATHKGRLGGETINHSLSDLLLHSMPNVSQGIWFHGRPVMMLKNDYQLGVSNGDIGICLVDNKQDAYIYFPHFEQPILASRVEADAVSTAFAITIHKSQGSEFTKVAVVLDKPKEADTAKSLLCKELIYTAITRVKKEVVLYTDEATLEFATFTKAVRNTGLATLLS